eukprot:1810501-Prymnesium_polylepis.1
MVVGYASAGVRVEPATDDVGVDEKPTRVEITEQTRPTATPPARQAAARARNRQHCSQQSTHNR